MQSQNSWRLQQGLRVCCWHYSSHRSFLSALLRCEKRRGGRSAFLTEQPPLLPRRVQLRFHCCQLKDWGFSLLRLAGKRGRAFRLLFVGECKILCLHFHINLPSALCKFAYINNVICGNWNIKTAKASALCQSTAVEKGRQEVLPSQRGAASSLCLTPLCHVSALSLLCHLTALTLSFTGVLLREHPRANAPGILPHCCLPVVQRFPPTPKFFSSVSPQV